MFPGSWGPIPDRRGWPSLLGHDPARPHRPAAEDSVRCRRRAWDKKTLSTLRDSDVERAIGDVLANLDRVESVRSELPHPR